VHRPFCKHLICWQVTIPEKIGGRVTIRIPTPSGYVEFKDVQVTRLQPLKE